jgi:hypothetical protein
MKAASAAEMRFVVRVLVELERTRTRLRGRWPDGSACERCEATNPITLGRICDVTLCYACKVDRETEEHSLVGEHLPPRVGTPPNAHKILDEVQRILRRALLPGVRAHISANAAAFLTVQLTALGSLKGGSR